MRKKVLRYFLQAFAMPNAKPAIDCFHFIFQETNPFISEERSPHLKTLFALYPLFNRYRTLVFKCSRFSLQHHVSIEILLQGKPIGYRKRSVDADWVFFTHAEIRLIKLRKNQLSIV